MHFLERCIAAAISRCHMDLLFGTWFALAVCDATLSVRPKEAVRHATIRKERVAKAEPWPSDGEVIPAQYPMRLVKSFSPCLSQPSRAWIRLMRKIHPGLGLGCHTGSDGLTANGQMCN